MRVVVVHRGARDAYQVAHAMEEAGLLERLVTDMYWPRERWPHLQGRSNEGVPGAKSLSCYFSGTASMLAERSRIRFSWKRRMVRWTDSVLGSTAAKYANRAGCGLLSYSYYAHSAFTSYKGTGPRILFQLHPHPTSVRRILRRELEAFPECAASLNREWELSLPPDEFKRLEEEPALAERCIVASSFTKDTLVENGIDPRIVDVVPYGVDLSLYRPGPMERARQRAGAPLRLLFAGTINQRKGIRYLAEAMKRFAPNEVKLRICGRVVDDLHLLGALGDRVQVTPSVSRTDLIEAYRSADLFVLPSVAEGFGQVLLEALACGLPILSTTRTAAPDLIEDGKQGFVIAPCNVEQIVDRIDWALRNRDELAAMRAAARDRASQFPWSRFRQRLVSLVSNDLSPRGPHA